MALGKVDETYIVLGIWKAMSTSKGLHLGDAGQRPVPVLGMYQAHPESEPQGPVQAEG